MQPQQKINYPQTERQRSLQALTFAENQILSRDLPRDTVLKEIQLRLSGSVVTTFGSGTPVADAQACFDNIIPRVDVIVGGSRTVKSVRPHLLRMQQLFTTNILGKRVSSAAATAATDNLPTVDANFTYGTTGQITTAAESLLLSFAMVYAEIGLGRESTWLNLKGVSSAELRLTCAGFSTLLGFGNTAPVVYTSSTFIVDVITVEAQDVPDTIQFSDFKQTTKQILLTAQTTDYAIDINRGNKLSGIMMFTKDGAAGTATTASGKLASNLVLTKIALTVNGQTQVKVTNFKALQDENRVRYGILAPNATNVSILDGIAHMNLLARKDASTALDCAPPLVDNVQLFVNTNTAANVSYTNPVSIDLMTEEIVTPR